MRFREDKTTQAAAQFLKLHRGKLNHMKLIKLLYLTDREALIRWGRPVTFDWYVSMDHGPVLSFTLNLINTQPIPGEPTYWHKFISERKNHEVRLVHDAPSDELSRAEIQLMGEINAQFGKMNQWQLVEHVHTLPEWHDPEGSALPIEVEDILRAGGHDEEDVTRINEALQAEAAARQMLGGE
jgi:uncharacterized phage-associated protein